MGHRYDCEACGFQFSTGWNHHESGASCICRDCGELFRVVSRRSCWGAIAGEQLPLLHLRRSGKRGIKINWDDTGRTVLAFAHRIEGIRHEVIGLRIEEARCIKCEGELLASFSTGNPCPKCRRGKMAFRGEVEY